MTKQEFNNILGLFFIGLPFLSTYLTYFLSEINREIRRQQYRIRFYEQMRFL